MIATTSSSNQRAGDGPNDIDRVLGEFFRSEVPNPWPSLAAPVKAPTSRVESSSLSAGRMALAASIAALLASGWFLSGRLPSPAPSAGSPDSGSATVPRGLRTGGTQLLPQPDRK
jgi:hypothetical protein